jgi:hypothetical protein
MLYGRLQNGIWLFFLVLGAATGASFIVRELGLGGYAGFGAWVLVVLIGGMTSYRSWRRDWGDRRPSPREDG